ncbi:MAG: DNA methyltransferase [Armatimonadota bacterium]
MINNLINAKQLVNSVDTNIRFNREPNNVLSFIGEKLTRGRHKIHKYPAMLHPLLVDYLLERYANNNSVIFDPFCGSGVTLLESSQNGNTSYGFDINPLALLIAKSKTRKYDTKLLLAEYYDLFNKIKSNKNIDIPNIQNIDYWYKDDVVRDLGRIKYELKNNDYINKNFFIVCFANICREQSLTRKGEFKRYRLNSEQIRNCTNKVFENFFHHTESMISIFKNTNDIKSEAFPLLSNSENAIPAEIKYDLVITSPPYGDSRTTVAYGQFSSFGSDWISDLNEYDNINYKVDNESLGKKSEIDKKIFCHKEFTQIVELIESVDSKRAEDVVNFFNAYYKALKNISANLNRNGVVCFVVGNRTVKGHQIPMDQITASFFQEFGLEFENILVRDISNKVMPSKNSPSNIIGEKSTTMMNEYIVILRKGKQ